MLFIPAVKPDFVLMLFSDCLSAHLAAVLECDPKRKRLDVGGHLSRVKDLKSEQTF